MKKNLHCFYYHSPPQVPSLSHSALLTNVCIWALFEGGNVLKGVCECSCESACVCVLGGGEEREKEREIGISLLILILECDNPIWGWSPRSFFSLLRLFSADVDFFAFDKWPKISTNFASSWRHCGNWITSLQESHWLSLCSKWSTS